MNNFTWLFTIHFVVQQCFCFENVLQVRQGFCLNGDRCNSIPKGSKSTALYINFGWFGGKDDNSNQQKLDQQSILAKDGKGNLGGVAGVMDSMERYKKAQRIGKMTASTVLDLQSTFVEGTGASGKVKVVFDCQQRAVRTVFEDGYFDSATSSDVEDELISAMKDAHNKSCTLMEQITQSFYLELGNGVLRDLQSVETQKVKDGRFEQNKVKIDRLKVQLKQDLTSNSVEGIAESGKVKVVYDCQQRPLSVSIDDSYFEAAFLVEDVCDAVTSAMQDAYIKSTERMDEKMKVLYSELGLP